ncbi:MAG: alkaline phosphatase family protein [Candidatus Tectomicrobia bacterium]|uniref:Alkaline phosphatase family protein n=1 Tax=Tectimicrobiota bacterium TaxID=2528274 RepID=A0A932GRU7_UNCTE|nr:alkaline phosphatase family protein [Candidatus Tectomicrobia bacterium]
MSKGNRVSRRSMLKWSMGSLAALPFAGSLLRAGQAAAQSGAQSVPPGKKTKVLVLGLDSCDMERLLEWVKEGELPTFQKLIQSGAYGTFENIFRGMSVDAWAAYLTGVGPGQNNFFGAHPWKVYDKWASQTSGINRFYRMHVATIPFMLAEAGVKVGMCGCAMTWPPERLQGGFMMSGKGSPGLGDDPDCKGHIYYTQEKHAAAKPLKTQIEFVDGNVNTSIRYHGMEVLLHLTLNSLTNTVTIAYEDQKVTLREGEWSGYMPIKFPNGRRGVIRWKPERLDAAGGELQLYRYKLLQDPSAELDHDPINSFFDGACVPTDQWTYPAALQREVFDAVGYYRTPNLPFEYDYSSFVGFVQEEETLLEDAYDATREQNRIVKWLLQNKEWDFFWFSNMPYDRLNHNMVRIKGNPDWSPEYERKYGNGKVMKDFTRFIDSELADLMKILPRDTYVVIISDHGWGPVEAEFQPNSWLKELGLLHVKPEVEGKTRRYYYPEDIDWSRTKAFSADNPGIFINLKGREENGIVRYAEYEGLRDTIIEELKKVKHPDGSPFIYKADRVENIYPKGSYGWYAGDIQFCGTRDSSGYKLPGPNDGLYQINWTGFGYRDRIWDHPRRHFTAWHGNALTTFVMTGPGVKKNADVSENGHMLNVFPTIMHIYGLVPPPNFEGRIMYEVFDPSSPLAKKKEAV